MNLASLKLICAEKTPCKCIAKELMVIKLHGGKGFLVIFGHRSKVKNYPYDDMV
jgi:hypothetical protein